jgi:hypothetical protein
MITVEQQYWWFKTYGQGVDYLRRMNSGTCQKTGKSFGEVIQHFIVGGDETCFMASDGEVYVINLYHPHIIDTPPHIISVKGIQDPK